MMSGVLVALPLHLACQLIKSGELSCGNSTIVDDTLVPKHVADLPEGYTVFPGIGVAYKYHKNRLSWNAGRKLCIEEGANLAIIDSFEKIEHVMSIKERTEGTHTGIHRLFDSVEWSNIKTGKSMRFIPWKPDANINTETGQCVAMWFDGSGVGPWNCANVLPTVCEIPIVKGSTSIPIF